MYLVYKNFFILLSLPLYVNSKYCAVTFHTLKDGNKGVFITSLGEEKEVELVGNFKIKDVRYARIKDRKLTFNSYFAYLEIAIK